MAEDGEEKLLATVQHIVQTLGSSDTMTEDILKVFSNYDGRLSLDKLYAARAGGGGGGAGRRRGGEGRRTCPVVEVVAGRAARVGPAHREERLVGAVRRRAARLRRARAPAVPDAPPEQGRRARPPRPRRKEGIPIQGPSITSE